MISAPRGRGLLRLLGLLVALALLVVLISHLGGGSSGST